MITYVNFPGRLSARADKSRQMRANADKREQSQNQIVTPPSSLLKHRQVTDLDVPDLGFSGSRVPFYATGVLWGRVTPFSRSLL